MDNAEKEQRLTKAKQLKEEISAVKKELNRLNHEKETWYKKRSAIAKQISSIISEIKGQKEERNDLTGKVKEAKDERDELNKAIATKVARLKELKAQNPALSTPTVRGEKKESPAMIKKQIEKIEYTLETQPMSFDKEQKLNKELKLLKKKYAESKTAGGGHEEISSLTKELNKLRKESNRAHKVVQEYASDSQERHEGVLDRSKEIDDLKVQEQEAFEKFKEFKDQFTAKNNEFKELVKQLDEERGLLEMENIKLSEDKKKEQQLAIKEKAKEVQEKVKNKQKLSTEDLLIFQNSLGK